MQATPDYGLWNVYLYIYIYPVNVLKTIGMEYSYIEYMSDFI